MTATVLAVALSLISAVAYAAAAVAQERLAARTAAQGHGGGLRLLANGAWWAAVGLNAGGALLHVAALRYGTLTLVQPLGALTLVAAVPLGAHRAGRRVGRREWQGTVLTLAGLAVLLLTASGPAPDDALSLPEALLVAGATSTLLALLARPGGRPGLRHATASGLASGIASALTQTLTVSAGGPHLPLWQAGIVALLVAVFAAGGLLLAQTAYRGGLGAPLAVLTLANPVAAAVVGLSLLGEHLRGGAPGLGLTLAGALVAAWGVVLLSRASAQQPGTSTVVRGSASVPPPPEAAPLRHTPPVPAAREPGPPRPADEPARARGGPRAA
ncbi:DMT family transporter [Streptomyces sp. P6-2-1]|uniref:DMT family transporter n=1 Tax=unclassified Streptomyces TaxID=2593676 RepID=UPI003D362323